MQKVANSCKIHCHAKFVRCCNYFIISYRATRLDYGFYAHFISDFYALFKHQHPLFPSYSQKMALITSFKRTSFKRRRKRRRMSQVLSAGQTVLSSRRQQAKLHLHPSYPLALLPSFSKTEGSSPGTKVTPFQHALHPMPLPLSPKP